MKLWKMLKMRVWAERGLGLAVETSDYSSRVKWIDPVATRSNLWQFASDVTAKKNWLKVGKHSMTPAFGSKLKGNEGKQADGQYTVLNREYKPIGFKTREHIKYEDYPVCVELKGITSAKAAKLSCKGDKLNSRVQ